MSSSVQDRNYPLRLPGEDALAVDAVVEQTKVSFNRVVSLCVRKGLPLVRADLCGAGRITNVDPLPDKVVDRIYAQPERGEAKLNRLVKAQASQGGPD